jgi:hypothetical protein
MASSTIAEDVERAKEVSAPCGINWEATEAPWRPRNVSSRKPICRIGCGGPRSPSACLRADLGAHLHPAAVVERAARENSAEVLYPADAEHFRPFWAHAQVGGPRIHALTNGRRTGGL